MKFIVGKFPTKASKYAELAKAVLSLPVDADDAVKVTDITENEAKSIKAYFQAATVEARGKEYRVVASSRGARFAVKTTIDRDTGQASLIIRLVSGSRGRVSE